MGCDLCGKEGKTVLAKIEGRPYDVCENCASYGSVVEVAKPKRKKFVKQVDEQVRSDASTIIRQARERSDMPQKEFAAMLNVKESLLHGWESGHLLPTIEMAKTLEKRLHISLLETEETFESPVYHDDSPGLTIGDMLKKKK